MESALRIMADRFTHNFGAPSALAKRHDIFDAVRKSCLRWLNDMEAGVRRLLLLRAALFPAPKASHADAPMPAATVSERGPRGFAPPWRAEGDPLTMYGPPEDSADWRVCFRVDAPQAPGWLRSAPYADRRPQSRGFAPPQRQAPMAYWADDPHPIAERFEALLRVLDDPDYYAERLAARLHFWRGRNESRQSLVRSLCAAAQIANEAGLDDAAWAHFAEAREMAQALAPIFSSLPPLGGRAADAPFPSIQR